MNEVTTLLKVGSADIVLRMIEAGVAMRDLTLENPIRAIREVSPRHHRPPQGPPGQRQGGQRAGDPAGVLRQGHRVRRAARRRPDRQAGRRAVGPGARRGRDRRPRPGVEREIDWVTKLRLIERYQAKHDLPLSHPRIAQMDLAYHDLRRSRGLYALLEKRGAGRPGRHRPGDLRGQGDPAADHPGPAARRVHPPRPGEAARLHRRLGAPQAERPGPAHRAVQGPVPGLRRAGRAADREHVTGVPHRRSRAPRRAT